MCWDQDGWRSLIIHDNALMFDRNISTGIDRTPGPLDDGAFLAGYVDLLFLHRDLYILICASVISSHSRQFQIITYCFFNTFDDRAIAITHMDRLQ